MGCSRLVALGALVAAVGCSGSDGKDGAKGGVGADGAGCTAVDNEDGTYTISCGDGTSTTISDGPNGDDGIDGVDGADCTVDSDEDGTVTISCKDGTSATVSDGVDGANGTNGVDGTNGTNGIDGADGTNGTNGVDGSSCTVAASGATVTLSCDDGTSVSWSRLVTRVFVTSATYATNFGGVAAANAICQDAANAQSLGGTWHAWLSDRNGNSPDVNFTHSSSAYVLLDGTVIANDWADLTDGSLQAPINVFEDGTSTGSALDVFTGTNTDGTSYTSGGNLCSDWTQVSGAVGGVYGVNGQTGATTGYWTARGTHWCDVHERLFCFEND